MSRVALLREQLNKSHEWLEGTMADVTQDQAHRLPPGRAHPIAERYAHAVQAEDTLVNAVLKGGAPLMATSWAGRTGADENYMQATLEKARAVKVDLAALRRYAQAVYAASDEYLHSLQEADLDRTRDMSNVGFGTPTVAWILSHLVMGHVRDVMGEISAVKGVHGLRGYPF